MPANDPLGYIDDTRRQAQVGILRGQEPTSRPMGNSQGDFLSHAGRFSPNPSGLNSLMGDSEFRGRFPNARIHKNDWVDLGDGSGLIDTVRGFNTDTDTGEAWQWLTEAEALRGNATKDAGKSRMASMGMNPAADNSAITRIMAELSAASQGEQSPAEREALLAMLQGGI
jgi:hypothetical protein